MSLRFSFGVLLALASSSSAAFAAADGAVFTTNRLGAPVAANQFARATAVHLAMAPALGENCGGQGLADGPYYFQVTDPSGLVLLSADRSIEERLVLVSGGVIGKYLGATHGVRLNGPCASTIVQLMPFDPAPHGGQNYKLWITRAEDYDPNGSGFFGFQAALSRTDEFNVGPGTPIPQSYLSGHKFFDENENGAWDPSNPLEVPIAGWRIELVRNGVLEDVRFTDENGAYTFIRDRDGSTYTLREIAPGGFIGDNVPGAVWLAKTPREFTVVASTELVNVPPFGNVSFSVAPGVGRTKGFWHNPNGRAKLLACEPDWRDALTTLNNSPLCLRRNVSSDVPALSIFAPLPLPTPFAPAFDDLKSWLVGDSALGHGGYILSTQVAAAILNSRCGEMQFNAYIDRFQNGVLVSFEDMLDGVQQLLCTPGAGLTGPHDPNQALRDMMLGCINEFGSINNSGDPNSPQVVFAPDSSPRTFSSPYIF
jgi:hypothetical protein